MKKIKVQILGLGCPTCKTLFKNVEKIVSKIDYNIELNHSEDMMEIVKVWAMWAPVFVVDDKVIIAWKVPSDNEIIEAIMNKIKENKDL